MKKINHIISYLFENNLILSLSKDWIYAFNGIPEFEVGIDNDNKLHIVSKEQIKLRDKSGAVVCE